ncbi:NAD-dependent epimerase/dehydratase family protein [Marinigracilibium pacificum]|uniref:NAD-dependent epimerase/dehydratase family protein n=1 Tax=Marinigracilibium pacificum TaxID=2729599 RepID=A0A848J7S7_9BACT|nr:NAD-dependent epimerase/dehydratase family protein [Marinigracilibium pacificum]NMM50474.1 NAD-dependent epimerase/dehydratase family protein [Marinigracilibium pacificum]
MRILITGGAGYIGSALTSSLMERNDVDEVIIYDNLSKQNYNFFLGHTYANKEKLKFIQGDLLDSRSLKKALVGVDIVYHLAAKVTTPFANSDPHIFEQVNHWGTAELVYALEESSVKKLIYAGSTSVYGSSKKEVTEKTIPNPRTFYGISKMRGEEHVQRLVDKMDTYILRCGNVYGYNKSMRFDAVINRFMFEANCNGRITIHGNGKQGRAFIHVDLLTKVLEEIAVNDVEKGTYNVVDRNLSVLDLVDVVKEIYPDLEYLFINQHLTLRELRVSSESSLRNHIDYTNNRSLREELIDFKDRFSF